MPEPDVHDEPVRRWVNPYNRRDWLRVLARNLTQRPHRRHSSPGPFIAQDTVVDASVEPVTSVAFVGDVMPVKGRRFDLADDLADFLGRADWLVANLEGVLWPGPGDPPKVAFAQRHHSLDVLAPLAGTVERGRLVVSVANNHAADFGRDALAHTVSAVDAHGHVVVGTLDQPRVRLGEINLAALTQWTNQTHSYLPFLTEHQRLTDPAAGFNLLYPHWGLEMETNPRAQTVRLGEELLGTWDAVVGHHPHVPAPIVADDSGHVLAYSLGQASSDIAYPLYHRGLVLRLALGPRRDGRWAVASAAWRFLRLRLQDESVVRAELRTTDSWFPDVGS